METQYIDLHMHSYYSDDGEFSPKELVEKCKKCGIKVMAIADHNSVSANVQAQSLAKEYGITYIPAIEIDCTYKGVNLHVLGYGIDYENDAFKKIEEDIDKQNEHASLAMLMKTQALGFQITEKDMEELAANNLKKEIWTGEMFAEVLLHKEEYTSHAMLAPYRTGGSRSDNPFVNFYWDYYSQGKPCYVEIKYPSLEEIIEIIHKHHGFAVLAHPGINLKERADLLPSIVACGIDGIEAFSSYHTSLQTSYFFKQAKDLNLFVTGGSDYHGKTKPSIALGQYESLLSYDSLLMQLDSIFKNLFL